MNLPRWLREVVILAAVVMVIAALVWVDQRSGVGGQHARYERVMGKAAKR